MTAVPPSVFAAKLLVLALGLLVVRASFRAYRRTGSRPLRSLTVAFGCITLGAVLGGIAHQFLGVGLETGVLVNSLLTVVGFAVLAHSLYASEETAGGRA